MNNSENNKIDVNELIRKASEATASGETSEKNVNDFISQNLSPTQAKAVKELLADQEKTKALMNSEAARMIFKKFFGGGNNG